MQKILIVEDDPTIADTVALFLRKEGYQTEKARDGVAGLELWRHYQPDLIVLDIGLPKLDGLEVLREIRTHASTPVIFLTARAEEVDELLGLGLGADDYISKPFSPRTLIAHIKAVLRRFGGGSYESPTVLKLGLLEVDTYRVMATVEQEPLNLTPTEFKLLHHLARTPGRAISRFELLEASMPESDALERAVDSHMKNLRHKLGEAGVPDLIETVRGVGYRLVSP
ncbi:MAG: response regulator transcription factor [Trueperaceae bacterium]|nr:response regulator transcription factor [Trueperaceae bacterium]